MQPIKRTEGSALLTALFIMTLVAIVATAMTIRLQLDIYRTRLVLTYDQLYLAAQGITFWGMSELDTPQKKFSRVITQGMVSPYPKSKVSFGPYDVVLRGGLYDLQGLFNLNNLSNKSAVPSFINLLHQNIPGLNPIEQTNLTMAIRDWVSPYDLAKGQDRFTDYYLSQKPPYYPSHQLMKSRSELRLIQGVNATTYLALEPLITALPEPTPLNLNTASKTMISVLGDGLNEVQVNEVLMARGDHGIKKFEDISELLKKLNLPKDQITLDSQYFLCLAYADSADFHLLVATVLKRNKDKKGKLSVSVISESINGI